MVLPDLSSLSVQDLESQLETRKKAKERIKKQRENLPGGGRRGDPLQHQMIGVRDEIRSIEEELESRQAEKTDDGGLKRQIGDTSQYVVAKKPGPSDGPEEGTRGEYQIRRVNFDRLEGQRHVANVPDRDDAERLVENMADAAEYHMERSPMARRVDEDRASKNVTTSYRSWRSDPRRTDYPGVDTPEPGDFFDDFDWEDPTMLGGARAGEFEYRDLEGTAAETQDGDDEPMPMLRSFDELVGRTAGSTVYLEAEGFEENTTLVAHRAPGRHGEIQIERPIFRDVPVRGGEDTRPEHADTDVWFAEEHQVLSAIEEGEYRVKE